MERVMGRWHPTKPDKHPELAVEVTLCHDTYGKIGIEAPKAAGEKHKTMDIAKKQQESQEDLLGDTQRLHIHN